MELHRGLCFCCNATKVVDIKADFLKQTFKTLFQKNVLDLQDHEKLLIPLTLCPICYHKVNLILKITRKFENTPSSMKWRCFLCSDKESVMKIKKWQHLFQISEDFVKCSQEDEFFVCLECFFYLDMRNLLKERLLAKFPELTDNDSNSTLIRSPSRKRNARTKAVRKLDLSQVQQLKPLKSDRRFRKLEFVYDDPKFFSQVPYTLLQISNFSKNNFKVTKSPKNTGSSFFKIKLKPTFKKLSPNIPKSPKNSFKPNKLKRIELDSSLVIKLPQMDLDASVHNEDEINEKEASMDNKNDKENDTVNGKLEKSNGKVNNVGDDTSDDSRTDDVVELDRSNSEKENINSKKDEKNKKIENDDSDNESIKLNLSSSEVETEKLNSDKSPENSDTEKETENVASKKDTERDGTLENDASNSQNNTNKSQDKVQSSEENDLNDSSDDPFDALKKTSFRETNENDREKNNKTSENTDSEEVSKDDDSEDNSTKEDDSLKRKRTEENGDTGMSPDKKKKRVTFSDEV